jgi:DNA-binding PadR family transcriptional regulator
MSSLPIRSSPFCLLLSLETRVFISQLTARCARTSNYVHYGYTHPVKTEAESLLPLPAATFHILVALADEDRHGYAVIKDVAARTGGTLKLGPGTLYRSVDRMVQQGLIREISTRPAKDMDDQRRRYYRITPFGREVAMAEARRLAQMLDLARAKGLAPRKA